MKKFIEDIKELHYCWNNRRVAKKNGCEYYGWYDYLYHCQLDSIKADIKSIFIKNNTDPNELPF